jgi:hypothetical protein
LTAGRRARRLASVAGGQLGPAQNQVSLPPRESVLHYRRTGKFELLSLRSVGFEQAAGTEAAKAAWVFAFWVFLTPVVAINA